MPTYSQFSLSSVITCLFFTSFFNVAISQNIERVDPPFWWVGMENDTLELLVRGNNLSNEVTVLSSNVKLISVEVNKKATYAFITINIPDNTPEEKLKIKIGKKKVSYELKSRDYTNKTLMGLSPADLIYLITPDRFANGNPKNDFIKGLNETVVDRSEPYGRHGGDIAGIHNKLQYLDELGVTALWLNPVLMNDQPKESYHGYAITDHYLVDPRYGTNEEYKAFIKACHAKGIRVIMDVIYNHFGSEHYLYKDQPESNFFNQWPEFTKTNYRATTLHDPYASLSDRNKMSDGWFDKHMPDVNQNNPHMSKYLIQNAIWWIEEFGFDAYRIDTYAYPDQRFMHKLAKAIDKEYPKFFIFGETWVHGHQVQAWYTGNNPGNKEFNSHLQSVTDFQLAFAIHKGLTENFGWSEGISRVYYSLTADYLYHDPKNLVTFVDNHDIARIYGLFDKDLRKYKMALTLLLTTRGIPQIYYGTEVLMAAKEGHGEIREDFWGGWKEDSVNKFEASGRSTLENEAFGFVKTLANYRKNSKAITQGKLMQFVPEKGVYVYFRYVEDEEVMVVLNASEEKQELDLSRFKERLSKFTKMTNVYSNENKNISQSLDLLPFESFVYELK